MRLRKNMKRTAAAVLALSMAVSAVAAPASAAYICDVSKGDVVVSRDESGKQTTITVGGVAVEDNKDGTTDIIITGDNTKPTESLNAEEENTSEVEKSGENASEVEKSGETKTEGKDKTQNSAAENKEQAEEPTSQELLAPEDEEKKDEQKKTEEKKTEEKKDDTQETEQTQKPTDKVLLCGQNDPEANKEATKQETKEKSYEDNAPTSLSASVQAAANNVVKIINKSAKELNVILRNLKVDAGETNKNAVTIEGTGDVTLELDGKNELKGGTGHRQPSVYRGSGLDSYGQTGTLTITDEDKNGSLTAVGGDHVGVVSDSRYGGNGIFAKNLTISGATVTAVGGGADDRGSSNVHQNGSVGGDGINANGKVKFSNATVTATGGSTFSDNTAVLGGIGLEITSSGEFIIDSGTNLTVTGGSAESETGRVRGGQGLYLSGSRKKMTVNGATLTLAGGNAKTNSTDSSSAAGAGMQGRPATDTEITNSKVTVIGGDLTGGRTKKANAVTINVALNNNFKLDGDTTFTSSGIISNISSGKITVAGDATLVQEDNSYNKNTKIELEENGKIYILGDVTVTENEDGTKTISGTPTGKKVAGHDYKVVSIVEATCTTPGKITYRCETADHSDTDEDVLAPLGHDFVDGVCTRCGAPEQAAVESNGGSSAVTLTVTGAGAYETSIADGRYIIAVPAETAVLSGCLGNLRELKAQGVNTLVFRTQLRETALNIDSMLSLGVDDTLFALTHSGESAELTVGGVAHNELLH